MFPLGWEDSLEESMATHSSILAWRIPMDRGAWRATAHAVAKRQRDEAQHDTAYCLLGSVLVRTAVLHLRKEKLSPRSTQKHFLGWEMGPSKAKPCSPTML